MTDTQGKLKSDFPTPPALWSQPNSIWPRGRGYVRLSRADLKQPGTTEEKFALRIAICKRIAEQYGIALSDADIVCERASGAKLATRPGILSLLEAARRGDCPVLITPYVDRLLRGDKRDEQEIEDTLCNARVTCYHADGEPIRFGPDYDPLTFEVKSLMAREELRRWVQRRRQTDLARLEMGKRSRSQAPYGYIYLKPTYDQYGARLTAESYETVPDQLEVVREAWQRVRSEPLRSLCTDFNNRGIPSPGTGRRANAAALWRPESLRAILLNPFYAGYLAQRFRQSRGKRTELKPEEYILAKQPGDWESVGTLEEWWEIIEVLRRRHRPGAARRGILTGILFAACGNRMVVSAQGFYGCLCGDAIRAPGRPRHPNQTLAAHRIEAYAQEIVTGVLALLDDDALGVWKRDTRPRRDITRERNKVQQELTAKRKTVTDMIERREFYEENFGEEWYATAAVDIRLKLDALKKQYDELETQATVPDIRESLPLLLKAREKGVANLWRLKEPDDLARLTAIVIRRIETLPPDLQPRRRFTDQVSVTLWPWAEATGYKPSPTLLSRK